MCAIAGIINFEYGVDVTLLNQMVDKMELRGPDDHGLFINNNVGFGHRRLSIIDVNSGHQPMSKNDENYVIVYNGETYNFMDIKAELQKIGESFETTSDTEAILLAYMNWGIKGCLDRMDGMFAFAIFDKTRQKVYVARDRYGEKPLYYIKKEREFLFASELKAFNPDITKYKINKDALNLFLTLTYIPAPFTIYDGIQKLEAGHYLEIDLSTGKVNNYKYYDVLDDLSPNFINEKDACVTIKELLVDSVKKRMIADVPTGAFLSGGIDSSIICCIMSRLSNEPINTFSIGYKEKDYDESERAEIVVNHIKSNHTKYILAYTDVLEILDDIILYYDEPFGDSSAIPSFYVAKLASEKAKVVLTGDCADELFGGYEKYLADYYVRKYKKVPHPLRLVFEFLLSKIPVTPRTNTLLRKIKKVVRGSKDSGFDLYYDMLCLGYDDNKREKLLTPGLYRDIKEIYRNKWDSISEYQSNLQKESVMDVKGVLEGQMFTKVDRACMHVSLENRAPFIDKRIVKFALNLDDRLKIKGRNKKLILKEAFKDILPLETLKYKKAGFGVPVDYWFRNELKEELMDLLDRDLIERQGLFNYDFISKIINEHLSYKENNKWLLWNLFVFQKWYFKTYNIHHQN